MKIKFFISFLVIIGMIYATQANDTKDVALVFKTNGKVEISKNGSNDWRLGKAGFRLNSGDKIRTGDNALAALLFTDDKSLIKVRSRSDLVVKGERNQSSIAKSIFMEVGEVFVSVKKQNAAFRLETPTGVAAVKGTEFWASEQDGVLTILAISGIVELINQYGSVLVKAGEKGTATKDNPPSSGSASDDELNNVKKEFEEVQQYDELKIEFENKDTGEKKTLKLRTKSKGN